MNHYRTVVVAATEQTTKQQFEKTTCDLCHGVIEQAPFSEEKVSIQYKTGDSFPEGGSGEVTGLDMCPTCFKDKLTPWLKSQGGIMHTVEWDW